MKKPRGEQVLQYEYKYTEGVLTPPVCGRSTAKSFKTTLLKLNHLGWLPRGDLSYACVCRCVAHLGGRLVHSGCGFHYSGLLMYKSGTINSCWLERCFRIARTLLFTP